MDNGTELTANGLRDWCRFSESSSVYIEPGSPPLTGQSGSGPSEQVASVA